MAYLVYDIGTGNSRVCIVSEQKEIIELRTFENKYYRDFRYEDALYFKPEELLECAMRCTKELLKAHPEIRIEAVTAAGARESIVLIDRDGHWFYGLPNIDNRGEAWIDDIPGKDDIYRKTGRWASPVFSAGKLMGLKKLSPELYGRIERITSLSEWIGYVFTGVLVMEYSQACESQLFDIGRREWDEEMCALFDVNMRILPEVCRASSSLGRVKEPLCEELGLPKEAVFIVGGADTQVAVYGTDAQEKEIVIVSGTTSPVVTIVPGRFFDRAERCWVDCYIDGRSYQVETNAGVSGRNYQILKRIFFEDVDYPVLDQRMKEKSRIMCVASLGTLIFSENKTLKNGGFYMPAPLDEEMDRYDFAFALMADIACSVVQQYNSLCEMILCERSFILGCGGGFQSEVLSQLIADLAQKTLIIRSSYRQASVIGCVKLCNDHFGRKNEISPEERVFHPKENRMIREYFDRWAAVRKQIN